MKKRSLLVILSLLLVACLSVFVACNNGDSTSDSSSTSEVTDSSVEDSSVEEETYIVTGVSMPEYYDAYLTVVNDTESIFTTNDSNYKVGDDNAMSVRPTVQGISNLTGITDSDIQNIGFVISVAKWNGEAFETMDNPGTDVDIDVDSATVDFVEKAVGNLYKVAVYPEGLTENQLNKIENYTVELVFEVVDGYNASSVIEFSLLDNSNKDIKHTSLDYQGEAWAEMRKQAGITVDSSTVNGIVLHANLSIDNTNVPAGFFYNEGDADLNASDADYERAKGSLRDWSAIFARYNYGKEFNIFGNYFNVSTANLPLIARDSGDIMEPDAVINSHATLIFVNGSPVVDGNKVCSDKTTTFENLNLTGNLKLSGTFETGGISFVKFQCQKTSVKNVVARQWFITAFTEYNESEAHKVTIEDCQFYDNYSTFLYNWGGYFEIKNSVMKACGGPVIIMDNCEYGGTKNPDGYIPTFNVDKTSVLESWVAGTETWFIQQSATAVVSAMVGLDQLFNYQGGVSYVKTEKDVKKINLIVVMKSGDVEGMSFDKISGTASIGSLKLNMDNPIATTFKGQSVLFQGASEQAFLAMNNGPDGTPYLADAMTMAGAMMQGQMPPAVTPADAHVAFTGDYLGIYVGAAFAGGDPNGYMGIVLGGYRSL